MKIMTCPVNGPRPIKEFTTAGAVKPMPNPQTADDLTWADYVFNHDSVPSVQREWWCHTPSNTWFIAERHTGTDEIIRTYLWEAA